MLGQKIRPQSRNSNNLLAVKLKSENDADREIILSNFAFVLIGATKSGNSNRDFFK